MSELKVLRNAVSLDGCGGFGKVLSADDPELRLIKKRKFSEFVDLG